MRLFGGCFLSFWGSDGGSWGHGRMTWPPWMWMRLGEAAGWVWVRTWGHRNMILRLVSKGGIFAETGKEPSQILKAYVGGSLLLDERKAEKLTPAEQQDLQNHKKTKVNTLI